MLYILKNRQPHSGIEYKTPYEMVNNTKPNLSHLHVFGSLVHIKNKSKQYMKLDRISSKGLFMTYTGTDEIIYVVDREGTNKHTCTHYAFDEAHMSPMAVTLQHAGYWKPMDNLSPEMKEILQFKRLSKIASIPTKATPHSARYDIASSENKDIPPHQQ